MKVLIYSRYFFPRRGGVPFASHMMAKALRERGHKVTVYTETSEDDGPLPKNVPYRVVRSTSFLRILQLCHWADVVLVNGGISRKAGLGAWLVRMPLVVIHQMARRFTEGKHNRWGHEPLRRMLTNYADLHIGVSQQCLASQALPKAARTDVIYNPIDPSLLVHKNARNEKRKRYDVLFAGRLIEGKGIFVLADALKQFEKNGVSLSVCFAGDGADRERLQSVMEKFESVRVTLPGMLDREQLAQAYSSARYFVIPTSTHSEGSPLVIAEAFAFGLPVIGSDQAVIEEVVGDAGLIFENGNAEDLFEKLTCVLTDNPLRDDLSQRALKRAQTFSFEHFADEFTSAVEEAVR